ncbi:amino acid adenylation domain-containing protein [Colletotrichum graminicola]|uniref:Amino acid adenylation domain-containing protein n=1 Tax=Colletotrichum graminicola (strain M1.001 / M2 / FGSC 10212) TaxID=645133 RepID=E3QKL0_COLGM|nr:amino acid adenylation domain-containing protein [Colletotrichum graminicola M1.001]EFQ31398.1 amino acid adenylation domain-containing protein [Colletotrichum graminicola M1.001]WDK19676.1 amino acid adenylation domain-containing protein [Colletotrichum graminicola]
MNDIDLEPELELSVLNPHPERVPGPRLLHQLVKCTSYTTPPAIHYLDSHGKESLLSYSQLHHAADKLASRVVCSVEKASASEDFVVPLLVPQSPHLYIAILAILKAGGAFCPLNLDAPPERVRFILQDVSAKVVIVSRDMVSKIPADEPDRVVLIVDEDEVEKSASSTHGSFRDPEPRSLAYVMYTSGSTGTPKGVGVSHDAAAQSLLAHDRHIPPFKRFLQFASPTFDVSVFEIFFPLFRGSTLVACDRGRMLNDLPAVIRTLQVDACELTPTVAGSLLRSRKNVPCLNLLLTIGEMLTESVIREFGGTEDSEGILWGMYGPTEAAIHCTVRPEYPRDSSPSIIGFPLDSVSCFVASIPQEGNAYEFRILPRGEPGELVVGGHQLANCYLNRLEQTQSAFLDTPYGRVYRTGDKAIMKSDGTLECLGRISDGQVKLRGQRIELGEIEQAAMRTRGCHSAVAMVLGGILVAFCAVDDTSATSRDQAEEVINTCRTWLPSFMVPGDVVVRTSFPRLPSGKVDRKHLRSEYETRLMSQTTSHTEPADPMEQEVAAIVFKSLGVPVSASTQLASSGVDSLRAIRLASALRDGGFQASAADILGSKTLSALCTILRPASKARCDEAGSQNNAMDPSEINLTRLLEWHPDLSPVLAETERVQWCTPLQSSMLAETSINPQAYCNWIKLEFPANNTTQDIEKWTHHMAENNEVLRSGFVSLNAGFAQVVYQRLPHTAVQLVENFNHDFCLASDEDYLHPFRAQIREGNAESGPTLLLQVHHSQYDGWSADILVEDYSFLLASRLPETRPQFRDVARFYADPTTNIQMDEARSFWADHMLGWQRHNLPRLMERPVETPQAQMVSRRLNIPQRALDGATSRFSCHPQVFFQAGLLWLWAGLQGQNDVVIGSVSSGRTIPVASVERVIGPCITTTPLRVNLANLTTIADLVRDIHSKNRQVLQHGILPLSDIKKIAGVNPGDALFDMLFVYQESLYSQQQRQGQVKIVSHRDFLETNCLVEIEPSPNGPTCRLTYRTSAISAQHIDMLMEQLGSVVMHLICQPENGIASIGKALPRELTSIFNANPSTLSGIPDLAASFEQSADLTPDSTAISFAKSLHQDAIETISFSTLNSLSNRIARYLQEQGAKEGDIVGLVMEKSIDLYAAMLGILKAGCAYLPLLPTTPAERIRVILAQAEVQLCVADAKVSTTLEGLSNSKFMDIQSIDMSGFANANLRLPPNPSRPAYVIYTSGTTGTPKGVVVTQGNVMSNLNVLSKLYPHSNRSRLLQACSQAFDVSVFEIFFTWKVGACLCSGTNDTLFEDLERAIRFLECTHLSMTPTVASLVDPRNVPTVEFLVTAGEPMTAVVAEKWTGYLFQGYGPAETTNICTVKKMKPGDFIDHLGFSFENTSTFVLDSATTDIVPIGCVGELCFGGDQVAAGYLGMPELTNAKFVDHPHFGRIYRSGDMGRMLPDGSLMVLGRMDDQLKLRGQRIDTGEISSVLTTSGLASSSAVVIVSRANSSASQLAVFYVPVGYTQPNHKTLVIDDKLSETNNTLFGLLRSRLPGYMVPTYLVPISSVPLTSSGKIDRAKLQSSFRELDRQYLDCAAGSLPENTNDDSWSENEKTIRTALSEVLNVPVEDITRWQPFAAVGLDSISAISLARRIQSVLQHRVPVSVVLRAGCVARLAQELQPRELEAASSGALRTAMIYPETVIEQIKETFSKEGKTVSAVLPCTPLQEAMLSSTKSSSYSNHMVFKLHVSEAKMKEYWEHMHRRHGILRTCFISTRDAKHAVAQVVLEYLPMPWHVVEVGGLREATDQHAQKVPDALDSNTPPVSLAVLKTEKGVYLSFSCHHALYDGVAMDALLAEVEQLATGKSLDAPADYMPVLLEVLNAPGGASEFWKSHFESFRPTQHQISAKVPNAVHDESTKTMNKPLEIPLDQLHDFCKTLGVSPLSLFQTAWAVLLSIVYGETDVCFGNVMSGRALSLDGIDRLVAPCFNTLPVRTEISPSTQLLALLKQFHTLNPQLLEYQFTPLRSIQTQVSKSGKKLFDSLLLLQQPRAERLSSVWELLEDSGTMDVPLVCELTPHPSKNIMDVTLHSNGQSMTEDAVAGLLGLFFQVVSRIITHPASSVLTRENLTPESLQALDRLVVDATFDQADQPDIAELSDEEDWSERESQIRSIVAELSNTPVSKIRRSTSIFQLGLDSINAVQLAAMMREQGLEMSALNVIEFPTCAKMASCIGTSSSQEMVQYDFAKFEQDVGGPAWPGCDKVLPCSPLQCAMLSDFIQSGGKDYLNYMSFVLKDAISLNQIRDAWKPLLQHHEILRTGFMPTQHRDASFAMVQYSAMEFQLPLIVSNDVADHFNVAKWKLDTAHNVLHSLHRPPWALALECGTSITMHIIMHHALYDAYSLQLILKDLSLCLSGRLMSDHPSIERAVSPSLQASVKPGHSQGFWEQKASEVVVNRFPTLTPLTEKSPDLLSESKFSGTTFAGLTDNARKVGISIQAILEAAWTRVLSAYLGEEDVVFGVVLSGRMDEEAENAVFPCINTVPVIAHNKTSNSELLHQLFGYNNQLVKHQGAPLAQIQRWLGHPNTRVFDTLLVYQRAPENNLDFPWQVLADEGNLDYPVSMEVEPLSCGKIQLRLTFRTDVLPRPQALHLLDQFDAAMQHLAQRPDESAYDLWTSHSSIFSILPPLEPTIPSEEQFLHSFVETKAQACPDKLALEFVTGFEGETPISKHWTFRELNERGNQVANVLGPYAQTGHTIAIHFDKCAEAIFSILGILKAGCAFLALDPSAPKTRKEFILKDSGALALLTNTDIDFAVEQPHIHVDDALLNSASPIFTSPKSLSVQDNSYCLYTSGTTGTPKGCEITHENAVQAMKAFQRLFDGHWNEDSRWMQFASFHFDVSVLEQYWSWSVGIPLVAAPRDLILDDLAGAIRRLNITHLDLTPSLARLLDPSEVPSLSKGVFITGGEALKQEILDVWGPVGVIYNAYGPTEATIGVTMYQRVPQNGRASNIGKQFDNVGSFVLLPGTDIPVMKGAVGELCVSGKLVGKGYLNRPELTQERFPFLEGFCERVYRTGDLVRLLHDGCFDFLGRADDQVKLRGQRLEIGEINHSIRTRVSEVSDVATLVTKHGSLDKDLLVTFVSCDSKTASKGELRVLNEENTARLVRSVQKACRDTLPGYMVPSYIFQVPFIPLSPNNKADIKQLNQLFRSLTPEKLVRLSPSSRAVSEPVNETQRRVLSTMREFLDGDANISLSSNIFDLGIDSISALRLSRLLRRNGLMDASPKVILRNPALADLAEALQHHESSKESNGVQEARQLIQAFGHRYRSLATKELGVADDDDIEYVAPCTPLQEGMLSRFMSDQDEGAYFTAFRLKLAPEVSIAKLKDACERLVQSHAILRTSFIQTPAGFAQVAIKSTGLSWRDLRAQDSTDIESQLSNALPDLIQKNSKNVCKPFELIVAQVDDQPVLVVHIFHALYDGISFEAMLRWVSADFFDREHETAPSFFDTLSHGPLANYDSSRLFWVEHLSSCSFDTLPRLRVGGATAVVTKTKTYSARNLETLRRSLNVTLQSVVLALWTSVFKKHFPVNAATGVIVSGRSIDMDQIENTIGPLFNTLLFYAGIKEGDTWLSLIQKCHEFNTSVLQFQHVPLRNIQKWCTKSRGRPIFENLFVFQIESRQSAEQSRMWSIMDDYSMSDYPLAFEASATPDGQLRVQIVAHGDLADDVTLDCLFEEIDEAMADVTSSGTHSLPVTENPSRQASTTASPRTSLTSRPESIDGDAIIDHRLDLNPSEFDWTPAALALRKEVAALSGSSEESINEDMALLALGLDSIDLVKLSARLKHIGYELTLSQLLRSQTIAEMAKILNEKKPSSSEIDKQPDFEQLKSRLWRAVEMTNFDLQGVEAVLPPTPPQESMVADMLQSDFEQYFNHDILELDDGLDVVQFEKAWHQVIEHSPILRTVFVQIEDPSLEQTFCQVVQRSNPLEISKQEAKDMADVQSLVNTHKEKARDAQGSANLLQLSVVSVGGRSLLVLSIAHALYDGWSLALLHQDVVSAYEKQLAPRPPNEPFLQSLIKTPTDQSRKFWSQYLANTHPSLLPERNSSGQSSRNTTHRTEAISSITLDQATSFCKHHAVSLQALGQACWASTLATLLQILEVTFGVVLAGRDSEQAQNLMFPTMNTVAVRCFLHGSTTGFLHYLQESMGDITEFQHYPLRKAQSFAGGRLFNTLFILQKNPGSEPENAIMRSVQGSSATEFAVCAELEVTAKSLIWRVAGQDAFVSEKATHQLLHQLDRALQCIVETPDDNLLHFEGDDVSICRLPPFQTQKSVHPASKTDPAGVLHAKNDEWTNSEITLRRVLSQVAGIDIKSIEKSHTLYNLGLDSISAIKVSALLRKESLNIGVRALLTSSSIKEMARQTQVSSGIEKDVSKPLRTSSTTRQFVDAVNISALLTNAGLAESEVDQILPPLPMQVYMISAWQNAQGHVFYPDFFYRLRGSVEKSRLESAWATLVDSEPILRTCLVSTGERSTPFMQIVIQTGTEGPYRHIMFEEEVATMDAERCWPQVQLHARLEDDNTWLLRLSLQHSLYDGFSLPGLLGKLLSILRGESLPTDPNIDVWRSFLMLQKDADTKEQNMAFWTKYLEGVHPTHIREHANSIGDVSRVSLLERSAVQQVARLQSSCARAGVGLPALFFAAIAKTLEKLHGESSGSQSKGVVFGIYYANRSLAENLEGTYPTLNLVPLKVILQHNSDILQVAKKIQEDLHLISSHSTVGLWEVKDWTGVEIDCFVNFLHFDNESTETLQHGDIAFEPISEARVVEELGQRFGSNDHSTKCSTRWLKDNVARDAFPNALDIEASIIAGDMDIGVFGTSAKISKTAAHDMIMLLRSYLGQL